MTWWHLQLVLVPRIIDKSRLVSNPQQRSEPVQWPKTHIEPSEKVQDQRIITGQNESQTSRDLLVYLKNIHIYIFWNNPITFIESGNWCPCDNTNRNIRDKKDIPFSVKMTTIKLRPADKSGKLSQQNLILYICYFI